MPSNRGGVLVVRATAQILPPRAPRSARIRPVAPYRAAVAATQGVSSPRVRAGLAFAFLGVLAFSLTLPMSKLALAGFDPVVVTAGRAAIAGVLAVAAVRLARLRRPHGWQVRPLAVVALCTVVGWPLLSTLALTSTTSAHAAVIAAGLPIATAVFAVLRAGEHPSRAFWVASTAGTLAVVGFALTRGGASGGSLVADLLMLGAVASAGLGYVEGAVLTRSMPGWQVQSWVLVLSLPLTMPVALGWWWATRDDYSFSWSATGGLLYVAVFSMYVGFFAWYRGLADAGVARGSQVQLLQAVLTLLWSVLLLGEQVGWDTMLAALLVIGCVAWTQRTRAPVAATAD